MDTSTTRVTTVTNHNILLAIVKQKTTKNALAAKAGIPSSTFNRKVDGKGDFTLVELGDIAEALGLTLWDILPANPISAGSQVPA